MDFSNRIISARKAKGLSQETLADMIGVSRQAISKWETGEAKPDVDKLIVLAAALDLSLDYLCLGIEPASHEPPIVSPTPEGKKEEPLLKNIQRLLIALLVVLALIVFCYLCAKIHYSNPVNLPQTGSMTDAQGVLNNYTIYSVRVEAQGKDLSAAIVVSVAYEMDAMEMQLILDPANEALPIVVLYPEYENGLFTAVVPRECYQTDYRVSALLTLDEAERRIPLLSSMVVEENSSYYEPLIEDR